MMMPLRVCLDEASKITFTGRICNLVQEDIIFYNFQDFIVKIDKFLDACGHPQSSINKRSMQDVVDNTNHYCFNVPTIRLLDDLEQEKGVVNTFDMHIRTRSIGDWQGEIIFLDKRRFPFTDILDLMKQVTSDNT